MATISEFINKIGFKVNESDVNKVNSTISSIKSTATKLLGAIGVGFSLTQLNAIAEEFNGINDKINYAVKGLGDQKDIQQKILSAANDTKTSYSNMADVVSQLVQVNSTLFPIDDALEFSTLTQKLLVTAGKSESEAASIQQTIAKTFQTGEVTSGVLKSLYTQAPEVISTIANTLGVATDSLYDLADAGELTGETVKNAILSSADAIESGFAGLDYSISDALLNIRNRWGYWVDDMNSTLHLTQTIAKGIVSGFDVVMRTLNKVRTGVVWLAEKLGGTQNLLKLIAIVAGSIFLAMNFSKIMSGLQSIGKLLSGINLKMLAIIAVIIILALLVDDFINFMQGNDSLLGSMLEKAGIDADAVRETIINAWEAVKSFLLTCWDTIKNVCSTVWEAIKEFFVKHGDEIKSALTTVWNVIKTVLVTVWNAIKTVATTVFNGLKSFWKENGSSIKNSFSQIWNGIKSLLTTVWNVIKSVATSVFNGLKSFWNTWGGTIKTAFSAVWETIKSIFSAALDILTALFSVFGALFSGNWSELWNSIKNLISTVWNAIKSVVSTALNGISNVMSSVWSVIKNAASSVWNSIKSTISNVINSIKSTISSVWNSIKSTTSSVWNGIKSSISGVINGIKSSVSSVFNSVKSSVSSVWNSIKSTTTSVWNGIKNAIMTPINSAWSVVSGVINKLKNAFNFSWSLPKLSLPHITVTGGVAPYGIAGKGSLPKFSISWYKKGGILTGAQIFGAMGNQFLGGGEAGKEAVLPLSELWTNMKAMIKDGVTSLTNNLSPILGLNAVTPETTNNVTNSTTNRNVVQNVNISNQFNGDTAIQQKASTAMKKSSADATAELARGLAFAK